MAITDACTLAEGKTINVYTDSRYAFGIAHDYGPIWRSRNFVGSSGKPIKNAEAVAGLMTALQLPSKAAIIKVQAHTQETTPEARGNRYADEAAKAAAMLSLDVTMYSLQEPNTGVDFSVLSTLQEQATKKEEWRARGADKGSDGIWRKDKRTCLLRVLYPVMTQLAHGPTHISKGPMCDIVVVYWIAPGFSNAAARFVQGCMICACSNIGQSVRVPLRCTPRPDYLFQRLQIDYIQQPRVSVYEYVLVCIDLFSGWPEAWSTKKATAQTTAKKLMNEVVCRYGIPEVTERDRGTHIMGELVQEVLIGLGIEQAFHTPYHPWKSGKVERLNGTLQKAMQENLVPHLELGYTLVMETSPSMWPHYRNN